MFDGSKFCALLSHELMFLAQAPLLTLMPLFYYYKLPLTTGCNYGHILSSQDKLRVPLIEDPNIPHHIPALSRELPDVMVKSGGYMQGDATLQRSGIYARQKPAFVPEFHGFEMFVWSMLSPKVETSLQLPAMQVTFIRRSLCSRRSLGSAKWHLTGLRRWNSCF